MITLYRRGKIFWARASLNNTTRRWTLRTKDRQVAEALRKKAELELLGGRNLVPLTWDEFQKEFVSHVKQDVSPKTLREYEFVLSAFVRFLADRKLDQLSDVSPGTIAAFTDSRRLTIHRINKRPKTDGGIRYDLRVLHRVFAYAVECNYIGRNPVIVKNRNARGGQTLPFSRDEVDKMLSSNYLGGKAYLRAVVLLFLYTGLRIGDVISLQKSAVAGDFRVLKTKKRGRVIALLLHAEVAAALKIHFEAQTKIQKASTYLFSTDAGRPIVSLDKHLRRLWKKCGISGGHAHRFRDTFAVRLLEKGASLYDVAKLMGISHQTAELHYTPYVKELRERGARLVESLDFSTEKSA